MRSRQGCFFSFSNAQELNAIAHFAEKYQLGEIRAVCFFHVQQAIERWVKVVKHSVDEGTRKTILTLMQAMRYCKKKERVQEIWAALKKYLCQEKNMNHVVDYLEKEWIRLMPFWSAAYRVSIPSEYEIFTNNLLEVRLPRPRDATQTWLVSWLICFLSSYRGSTGH